MSFMELMLRAAAVYGWVKLMEVGANLGDCTLWTAAHLGRCGSEWVAAVVGQRRFWDVSGADQTE